MLIVGHPKSPKLTFSNLFAWQRAKLQILKTWLVLEYTQQFISVEKKMVKLFLQGRTSKYVFHNDRLNFAVSNVIFIYIIYLDGGIIAINQLVEISIKIKERPLLTLPLFTLPLFTLPLKKCCKMYLPQLSTPFRPSKVLKNCHNNIF